MAVVNNGGTGPHVDYNDFREGCCCVVPFGINWTGGELVFRDLGLAFKLKPGDVIFFRSAKLVHENLPHSGDRRSIVLTTDENAFTGKGQPLEPNVVKSVEAYLLAIRSKYENWTASQRRAQLVQNLHDRSNKTKIIKSKVEAENEILTMAAEQVDRTNLRSKLVENIKTRSVAVAPRVVFHLQKRLLAGKAPLRFNRKNTQSRRQMCAMPVTKPAGRHANARSRNQHQKR